MSITSDAASRFADYNIPGDASSGVLKPDKALIRALFASIDTAIAAVIPTGSMWPFAHDTAPAGFLICDGAEVSRTTYADLWAFAQASAIMASDATDKASNPGKFWTGNGSTTFTLPKIEDFVRGTSSGRGAGTFQADANGPIGATVPAYGGGGGSNGLALFSDRNGSATNIAATLTGAGGESRPKNTAYAWIIKT